MKKIGLILLISVITFILCTYVLEKMSPPVPEEPMVQPSKPFPEQEKQDTPSVKTHLKRASFADLPHWEMGQFREPFRAFKVSCNVFLKQSPERSAGSKYLEFKVKDWLPACEAAKTVSEHSESQIKAFFEQWFTPALFYEEQPLRGLFTGYYFPLLKGNVARTTKYPTPIYSVPRDLVTAELGAFDPDLKYHRNLVGHVKQSKLLPYHTREAIDGGAIKNKAKIIAWVESEVERLFLEIEGSGIIQLPNGRRFTVGYAGQNGHAYTPVARVLIEQGVMTRDTASMQAIRRYFKENPSQVRPVLNQNKSFVFFEAQSQKEALGAQGVPLTPGYSLAVDRKWIPLGMPVWLDTTSPDAATSQDKPFRRLMIAQDTGGAIRGAVRGDVYWGAGEEAIYSAGHMKHSGIYWLLLPKHCADLIEQQDSESLNAG